MAEEQKKLEVGTSLQSEEELPSVDIELSQPPAPSSSPVADHDEVGRRPMVNIAGALTTELPLPGTSPSPVAFDPQQLAQWQEILAEYEREMAALGQVPAAAGLAYEMGKIWEEKLAQSRNAWNSYNRAFQLNPRLVENIRAACRLASRVGNWSVVLQIIDSELQVVEDSRSRAYLHLHKGVILEHKLGKLDEARLQYRQAAQLEPQNLDILKQLERLAALSSDWDELLAVRRKMIEVVEDPQLRAGLLLDSAQILHLKLGREEEAEKLYQEVLGLQPENTLAMQALRQIYARRGQVERQIEMLKTEAAASVDPQVASLLLYEAARLLREKLSEEEKALELLQKAHQLAPANAMVLMEMASIYESLMRWGELVEVCEKLAASVSHPADKMALYFKIGQVLEDKLFLEDRAIEAYRKVVEINPRYLPALQALGKLFSRKREWQLLAEMYELEIRETQDPRQKAVRLYKLAEVLEDKLGKDQEAIEKLEQSLELNPGYLPALKSLGRLYLKYERWESLIRMYEGELASTSDREQSVFLLDKIASIWEDKLGNIDKAIETYQRLLRLAPTHLPTIRNLGKLYVQAERWQELIQVNELEAQLINDQKQVVSLLHRNGEIYEEKLNDKDRAIETYQKVLSLAPSYLPALQSLGRLYFLKGRWEDLIDMYRQEIEVSMEQEQQVSLLYKIGQLYEEKLLQEDKAINVYREILRLQPTNVAARKALERLYTNRRDWNSMIEILQHDAEVGEDPQQKAFSLLRAAEITYRHMNDAEGAIQLLRKILTFHPQHVPTQQFLATLLAGKEDWRGLLQLYQQQLVSTLNPIMQINLLERMAELSLMRLGDLTQAAEYCEKILLLDQNNLRALEMLEQVALSQRNWTLLAKVYQKLAEITRDERYLVALELQLAYLKENRLQPAQSPAEHLLRVLKLHPNHPEGLRMLEFLYQKYGTWEGLRLLYEMQLTQAREVGQAVDLCLRLADLVETRFGDDQLAVHYLQEVLRLEPEHLPAIKQLRRIRLRQGQYREAIWLLEREARVCRDRRQAEEALLLAANLQEEKLGDAPAAIETYFRVLEGNPQQEQAFLRLEKLLQAAGNYERLSVLYRNRLESGLEPADRLALLLKLGALYHRQLGRQQEAAQIYAQVFSEKPDELSALVALSQITFDLEQWKECLAYTSQLLQMATDKQTLAEAALRLGIIYQEKLPELQKAVACFEKVLEFQPENLEALERLKVIYLASQKWADAVAVLERMAQIQKGPSQQIPLLMELAGVYEKGLVDPERAVAIYQQILQYHPQNFAVLEKLGQLYEQLERWQEYVETYQGVLKLLPPERAQEALPLYMKLGQIYHEKLGQLERAIIEYKKACEINPRHLEAHEQLARLYGSNSMFYANAIDEHRKLLEINPFRVDSYHQMRRIFEEQRAFDKMLCVCGVLHFLKAATPEEEFFYGENRNRVPERTEEKLDQQSLERLLIHPAEKSLLRELLKIVGHNLGDLYKPQLDKYGVSKANRVKSDHPLGQMVANIKATLGEVEVEIYLSPQPHQLVIIEPGSPPVLIVGDGLVKRASVRQQRFALGRAIKSLFDGSYLALALGERELTRLIAALVYPYNSRCPLATCTSDLPVDLIKRVQKELPRKARKELEKKLEQSAQELELEPDYTSYMSGVRRSANRFGLLMGNDVQLAIEHCMREIPQLEQAQLTDTEKIAAALTPYPVITDLLVFAVSEEYFRLRQLLKFSIVS